MKQNKNKCCARSLSKKEIPVEVVSYERRGACILEVDRFFWQSFTTPDGQSWMIALQRADQHFYSTMDDETGLKTLATVQAMRMCRGAHFNVNSPGCRICSLIANEHERQKMSAFTAIIGNRIGAARAHARLLCKGNGTSWCVARMCELVKSVTPVVRNLRQAIVTSSCRQPA
ncbi:MAG: hypothetical protein ABJ360_23145 [Roseobacter sp.]